MAGKSTDPPPCDADDWLVVSNEDDGLESSLGSSNLKTHESYPVLHTSQTQSQSIDTPKLNLKTSLSNYKEMDSQSSQTSCTEIFKVLVWMNGLETPIELVDENQKPLNVAAEGYLTQKMGREFVVGHPQLRRMFPHVTRMNVNELIQVCERSNDEMKWVQLRNTEEEEDADEVKISTLQLTSQKDSCDTSKYRQLLIESKFEAILGGEFTDWRRGRFYSDILDNVWRFELQVGQLIDALDTDKCWYESRIVDTGAVYVKVHYRGWSYKWDEWLRRTSTRLAPLHTKVPDWRAFHVNDEILVGTEVSSKSYPEWRYARVTACAVEDQSLQIEVDVDGKKTWMDAQDELLCQKGTHKAVNACANEALTELAVPHTLLVNYFERPKELPPSQEQPVDEVESLCQATRVKRLANAAVDKDEWCVVDTMDKDCGDRTENAGTAARIGSKAPIFNNSDGVEGEGLNTMEELRLKRVDGHDLVTNGIDQVSMTVNKNNNWRHELQVGQLIDARDTDNNWYESRVVALNSTCVKLHYRGWTSKWDEWIEISSTRIAPLHTKVRNWRAFKVGDGVMVGRHVTTKKYPEWRNAIVTNCTASGVDGSLCIEVETGGCQIKMDAQDEMLCPLGTHKAVNSSFHSAPLF